VEDCGVGLRSSGGGCVGRRGVLVWVEGLAWGEGYSY
jgi:hypothetical protein